MATAVRSGLGQTHEARTSSESPTQENMDHLPLSSQGHYHKSGSEEQPELVWALHYGRLGAQASAGPLHHDAGLSS